MLFVKLSLEFGTREERRREMTLFILRSIFIIEVYLTIKMEIHNIKNFDHYFEDLQENILVTQNCKYKKIMTKMGYQC